MSSDTAPGWIPGAGLTFGGLAKKPKRMLNWNTNVDVYRQCSFEILNGFLPNRCYVLFFFVRRSH
jgi:hypothetical protein